ncbi:MAG TPA: Flp family type IVb pilin [Streptosporangiaceae bacterium]|nr:Flp family type IVb pilin [Streptosporangiaceae bacterium]
MLKFVVFLQGFLTDRLRRDDRGATAVEYGLIVALIAGVIIVAVTALGANISTVFTDVAAKIAAA